MAARATPQLERSSDLHVRFGLWSYWWTDSAPIDLRKTVQ